MMFFKYKVYLIDYYKILNFDTANAAAMLGPWFFIQGDKYSESYFKD